MWTHLGRVDDQTHEGVDQHGAGQLLAPQLRFVQRQAAGVSRDRHRVGVSQRRHGAAGSVGVLVRVAGSGLTLRCRSVLRCRNVTGAARASVFTEGRERPRPL